MSFDQVLTILGLVLGIQTVAIVLGIYGVTKVLSAINESLITQGERMRLAVLESELRIRDEVRAKA